MDSAESAFRLRQEFDGLQDGVSVEPVVDGYGTYGDFQLVGHGKVTNEFCGTFLSFKGCLRGDLHEGKVWKGLDCSHKAFIRVLHHWCNKPSCPTCFESGWAVREAGRIEERLKAASKHFGEVHHIVASVPLRDYGLSFEALRSVVVKALSVRRVVGGVLLFHGFRYNNAEEARRKRVVVGWYWSPHWHCLGFILGGFSKCRHCENVDRSLRGNCRGCSGFYGKSMDAYGDDAFIVEVMEERLTLFGTAWYLLNHASLKVSVPLFRVATWWGVCSYRKLKVTPEKRKDLCPICHEELFKLFHVGARRIVKVKGERGYAPCFLDGLVAGDGSPNWVLASGSVYR
jgi:hypothetical protein